MTSGNGHPSPAEFEDLHRRLMALETRMDREFAALEKVIHGSVAFEQSLNARLDLIHELVTRAANSNPPPSAGSPDSRKIACDVPACDDDLDARILALRRRLAAQERSDT
jgi:hypothetical protein